MSRHELPALPYAFDALEPHIDARTMEIHHGKHHAAYVNNLNAALDKHPKLFELSVEELVRDLSGPRGHPYRSAQQRRRSRQSRVLLALAQCQRGRLAGW